MSLFEDKTYERLLDNALSKVDSSIDKREGSIIYNALAPAIAELAQAYIGLDFIFDASFISTAPREYLIKLARDRGIEIKPASNAVFKAEFNIEIPIGARFSCEDLNFSVTEKITSDDTVGNFSYKLICETPGNIANSYRGSLIPIEYIDGLKKAQLTELLIPGDDEEDTEAFRQRVLDEIKTPSFGGNQADYKKKVLSIDGVSAVKVIPAWNGGITPSSLVPSPIVSNWYESGMSGVSNEVKSWIDRVYSSAVNGLLTTGGCVKIIIMSSDNSCPSEMLINNVQTVLDPIQNSGVGVGLAPIGHIVKVSGVGLTTVNVSTNITLSSGWTWDNAKPYIEAVIDNYFTELAKSWADCDNLTVRTSQLESRILRDCQAIVTDITGTMLNNSPYNIVLSLESIPVRGELSRIEN